MTITEIRNTKTGTEIGIYNGNKVLIENVCGCYLVIDGEQIPLDSGRGREIVPQIVKKCMNCFYVTSVINVDTCKYDCPHRNGNEKKES